MDLPTSLNKIITPHQTQVFSKSFQIISGGQMAPCNLPDSNNSHYLNAIENWPINCLSGWSRSF